MKYIGELPMHSFYVNDVLMKLKWRTERKFIRSLIWTVIDNIGNLCIGTPDNKIICLNVLYKNERIFTGQRFKTIFNIHPGEKFGM